MGYYTDFHLVISGYEADDLDAIGSAVSSFMDKEYVDDEWFVNAKWYDHDEDMLSISVQFPDVLFTLDGVGESTDDMWYTYYKNGAMQYAGCRIEHDDFDPKKMQQKLPPSDIISDLSAAMDAVGDLIAGESS